MYLSCSTLCFKLSDYPDIHDVLARIKTLGFAAVDLAAFENWQNVNPSSLLTDAGPAWVREFSAALAKTGLRVSSFNCGPSARLNDSDPVAFTRYIREYRALLDFAETVGCPNLTVQPGYPIDGQSLTVSQMITQSHLEALAKLHEGRSVTLSVEGHQGSILENPADALTMMRALWPAIGFTYDPSHWVMQDIPLPETAALLDVTYHVHVRNAALDKMQETMAAGVVDFHWLIPALVAHGYDGAIAIEYFEGFDVDLSSTIALRDLVWEMIG